MFSGSAALRLEMWARTAYTWQLKTNSKGTPLFDGNQVTGTDLVQRSAVAFHPLQCFEQCMALIRLLQTMLGRTAPTTPLA